MPRKNPRPAERKRRERMKKWTKNGKPKAKRQPYWPPMLPRDHVTSGIELAIMAAAVARLDKK